MATPFEQALATRGHSYLEAEHLIVSGGAASAAELRRNLTHPDPFVRGMARALLPVTEGRAPEFRAALEYLARLPARIARTPIGKPSPSGTAAYLDQHFAGRAAEPLAVRLVKQPEWPRWQVMAVLLHLQHQALPATNAALIRFAVQTADPEARDVAVETVLASQDPELLGKLTGEHQRLHAQGAALPVPLDDLRRRLAGVP
jgi:hypothetical protein